MDLLKIWALEKNNIIMDDQKVIMVLDAPDDFDEDTEVSSFEIDYMSVFDILEGYMQIGDKNFINKAIR